MVVVGSGSRVHQIATGHTLRDLDAGHELRVSLIHPLEFLQVRIAGVPAGELLGLQTHLGEGAPETIGLVAMIVASPSASACCSKEGNAMGSPLAPYSQSVAHFPLFDLRPGKFLLVALVIVVLSGCAAFEGYPERATKPAEDLEQLKPQIDAKAIAACLDAATLVCRNKIIAARMHATDIRFSEFEETLFRETRKVGFGATLATLGLTSAAAASSGGASQVQHIDRVPRDFIVRGR